MASSRLCKSTREQSYFVWVVSYTEVPVDQVIDKFPFLWGDKYTSGGGAKKRVAKRKARKPKELMKKFLSNCGRRSSLSRRRQLTLRLPLLSELYYARDFLTVAAAASITSTIAASSQGRSASSTLLATLLATAAAASQPSSLEANTAATHPQCFN